MKAPAFNLQLPEVHLFGASPKISPEAVTLKEVDRAALCYFLATVADSALKVKILGIFLSNPGICLPSLTVANRLNRSVSETREAVQQLAEAGALNYCPSFAYADLCHLSLSQLPEPTQLQLDVLIGALRHQPKLVWGYLETKSKPVSRAKTE